MNCRHRFLGILFLILMSSGFAKAEKQNLTSNEYEQILVVNALLLDPDGSDQAQTVNLLINKGMLKLITLDTVSPKKIDLMVDAEQGFILGKLDIGKLAGFMILSKNPRGNPEVILDTKTYVTFAMNDGVIIRNQLTQVSSQAKRKSSEGLNGWFAYNAPPMSLSTYYKNLNKWNRFESKPVNATFLAALILDRMKWLEQDAASVSQNGNLDPYSQGEIRGLRFGAVGSLNFDTPWIFTFFAATTAFDKGFDSTTDDGLGVFDLRLDIPFYRDTTLSIGKQKEPISMERLTSLVHLPMQERSAVADAMLPSRNIGLLVSGTGFERRTTWAGGVFNPWLNTGTSIEKAATQVVGRGTWLAAINGNESSLLHLGVGGRYSNAKGGLKYATEPEFNSSPTFVNTGSFQANYTMLYDLEAAMQWGPLLLNGEYLINFVDAEVLGNPVFTGYHATLSYILTGEVRPYNRRSGIFRPVPISNPVSSGGWGAWEVSARYSNVDLTDGAVSGGDMDIYSLGLNWWPSTAASFGVNYRHIVLNDDDSVGHSDGLMARLVLILE